MVILASIMLDILQRMGEDNQRDQGIIFARKGMKIVVIVVVVVVVAAVVVVVVSTMS